MRDFERACAHAHQEPETLTRILQVGVYFTEVDHGEKIKYVPRSVQLDLEDGVLNRVSLLLKQVISTSRAERTLPVGVIADRAHGDKRS